MAVNHRLTGCSTAPVPIARHQPEMHSRILSKRHCSRNSGIPQGPLPTACQQQWSPVWANAGTQPLRAGSASVEVKHQGSVSILPIQPQQDQHQPAPAALQRARLSFLQHQDESEAAPLPSPAAFCIYTSTLNTKQSEP